MTLDEAIDFLKQYVKYSAVPGQKHIDPSLVNAEDLGRYEQAFKVSQDAVLDGEITEDNLRSRLGLA